MKKIKSFISKNRKSIIILFILILIEIMGIYLIDFIETINIDVNAEDIKDVGIEMRNSILKDMFSFFNGYDTLSRGKFKIMPLVIIFTSLTYLQFKNNLGKYMIGKTKKINKILKNYKFKLAFIPIIYYFVNIIIIALLTILFKSNFELMFFKVKLLQGGILDTLLKTELQVFIAEQLMVSFGIYFLTYLCLNIMDYLGKLRGTIAIITLCWAIHLILNLVLIPLFNFSISEYSPGFYLAYTYYGDQDILMIIRPLYVLIPALFIIKYLEKNKSDKF